MTRPSEIRFTGNAVSGSRLASLLSGLTCLKPVSEIDKIADGCKTLSLRRIAVHHITTAMFANEQICSLAGISVVVHGDGSPDMVVAYNPDFEGGFISVSHAGDQNRICTFGTAPSGLA